MAGMRSRVAVSLVLALAALVASCGGEPGRGRGGKGTLRPYSVKGKTYYPLASAHGFSEEGKASWYGPGFHGHSTANGERYDMHAMTAAHKVLPMNTMVRVANQENGRSVMVRINDRGPFVSGRVIDLSLAAAKDLRLTGSGTARVRVSTVGDIPGMKEGELPGPFYVQVGAFAMRGNADKLYLSLMSRGFLDTRIQEGDQTGTLLWRVQAGLFATVDEAQGVQERLKAEFPDAFVIAQ